MIQMLWLNHQACLNTMLKYSNKQQYIRSKYNVHIAKYSSKQALNVVKLVLFAIFRMNRGFVQRPRCTRHYCFNLPCLPGTGRHILAAIGSDQLQRSYEKQVTQIFHVLRRKTSHKVNKLKIVKKVISLSRL